MLLQLLVGHLISIRVSSHSGNQLYADLNIPIEAQ